MIYLKITYFEVFLYTYISMESSTPSDQTFENQWLNKAYYMPLINKSSTTFGPIGQWVYINGALFDSQTTVLLDDIPVEDLKILC